VAGRGTLNWTALDQRGAGIVQRRIGRVRHDAVQQFEHMPANAFAAAILGDVHAVVPLANIRRPDGSHGLVAQNRVQIVAQILLVFFLGGLLNRLVVHLATLFHIVGCAITEQYLAAGISIVRNFRRSPCVQVNQPLCLVEPCFRLGLIAFVESLVNARRKMRILGSGFDGRYV